MNLKGWKTVMFNAIVLATGVAEMLGVELPGDYAADVNGFALAGIAVFNIGLRAITNTPLGER